MTVGLDESHPLTFLAQASGIWAAINSPTGPTGTSRPGESRAPDPAEFLLSLIETDARRSTALLTAMRPFITDPRWTQRVDAELADRDHGLPGWLASLNEVRVGGLSRQTEPLQDGDQYWIELLWPDGQALALGVLVDFNWGRAFKDLMPIAVPLVEVERSISAIAQDDHMTFVPIDGADLRAQVEEAIARTDMFYPPLENESWPMGRPLLTWALGMLDQGGVGFPEYDLEEPARQRVVRRFARSTLAPKHLDPTLVAGMVDTLVWYAGFSDGDPLRWSPTKVEILLTDFWHRKTEQTPDEDRLLPDLLRAFVRWCGKQKKIPVNLVNETLSAIDHYEPEFLQTLGTPRRNTALELARLAAGIDETHIGTQDDLEDDLDEDIPLLDLDSSHLLELLAQQFGGHAALDAIGVDPLPDEPFDETGIEPNLLPRLRQALDDYQRQLATCGWPEETELRTAGRRLLRLVALGDPALLARRVSPGSIPCTLALLVYGMNNRLGSAGITMKALTAAYGMKGAPQARAEQFDAVAFPPGKPLDPCLLSSRAREGVIDMRDTLGALKR